MFFVAMGGGCPPSPFFEAAPFTVLEHLEHCSGTI
jgi:hypothetical protein